MLNHLKICLTVAALLLAMLAPAQAEQTSSCPGAQAVYDLCHAPGTAAPGRHSAEKPCLACVLPTEVSPRAPAIGHLPLGLAASDASASSRVVPPDRRPPRA